MVITLYIYSIHEWMKKSIKNSHSSIWRRRRAHEFSHSFMLERSSPRCEHCRFSVHIFLSHCFPCIFLFLLALIHCLDMLALLISHLPGFHLRLSCTWVRMNRLSFLFHSPIHSPWINAWNEAQHCLPSGPFCMFLSCDFPLFSALFFLLPYTLF